MANQTTTTNDREIDLGYMSRTVKNYLSRVNDSLFDAVLFVKRYIIIIAVLVAAGIALGIYKDKETGPYEHKLFVTPNFGSVDYLYGQVTYINTKLRQKDYAFLEATGLNKSGTLGGIKIEPVADIYNYIDDPSKENEQNDRRFQLFKLVSESGDLDTTLEDEITGKNFTKHLITVITGKTARQEDVIQPLMDYLNANPYYRQMQEEYKKNLELKIVANDSIIKQIDQVLNSSASKKGGNMMYYNDNTQLNEIIKLKDKLVKRAGKEQDRQS